MVSSSQPRGDLQKNMEHHKAWLKSLPQPSAGSSRQQHLHGFQIQVGWGGLGCPPFLSSFHVRAPYQHGFV